MKNQKELIRRIIASFFLLFIVEIGKHIPIPFFISEKIPEESTSLILKFLATSTGGNFTVPTLFSLGMGPYMTALIIWTNDQHVDTESIGNLSTKMNRLYSTLYDSFICCPSKLRISVKISFINDRSKSCWGIRCPVVFRSSPYFDCWRIVRCVASRYQYRQRNRWSKLVYRSRSIDEHPSYVNFGTNRIRPLESKFYDWFGYSDFNLYLSNAFPLQCRIPHSILNGQVLIVASTIRIFPFVFCLQERCRLCLR